MGWVGFPDASNAISNTLTNIDRVTRSPLIPAYQRHLSPLWAIGVRVTKCWYCASFALVDLGYHAVWASCKVPYLAVNLIVQVGTCRRYGVANWNIYRRHPLQHVRMGLGYVGAWVVSPLALFKPAWSDAYYRRFHLISNAPIVQNNEYYRGRNWGRLPAILHSNPGLFLWTSTPPNYVVNGVDYYNTDIGEVVRKTLRLWSQRLTEAFVAKAPAAAFITATANFQETAKSVNRLRAVGFIYVPAALGGIAHAVWPRYGFIVQSGEYAVGNASWTHRVAQIYAEIISRALHCQPAVAVQQIARPTIWPWHNPLSLVITAVFLASACGSWTFGNLFRASQSSVGSKVYGSLAAFAIYTASKTLMALIGARHRFTTQITLTTAALPDDEDGGRSARQKKQQGFVSALPAVSASLDEQDSVSSSLQLDVPRTKNRLANFPGAKGTNTGDALDTRQKPTEGIS